MVFLMKNTYFVEEILLEIEFEHFFSILYAAEVYCVCYFNDFSDEKTLQRRTVDTKVFSKEIFGISPT